MIANPFAAQERPGEAVARADVFLRAMAYMDYVALNVGVHEVGLGLADLRKLAAKHKMPLLSANVWEVKADKPAFQPTLVKKSGPLTIGFFGLMTTSPPELGRHVVDQGLAIKEPIPEAKKAVAALKAQGADFIVLLSALSRTEIEAVTAAEPGIHLVLGSSGQELSMQLAQVHGAWFADAFTKGKYVGEVTVQVRDKRDRFYPANLRASLEAERSDLAQRLQGLQAQLESADQPGGPLQLNAETRGIMEKQLSATRARLQRLTGDLDGQVATPADASTLELTMTALGSDLKDDPEVDGWVKKHQQKFPKAPGGH